MEALKSKITKNKNGEIVSHLEITEVVLAILVNNDYQYGRKHISIHMHMHPYIQKRIHS